MPPPRGTLLEANQGAIVRISNTSCAGTVGINGGMCPGTVVERVNYIANCITSERRGCIGKDVVCNTLVIEANGIVGKYVTVQLPGEERIADFSVKAQYTTPPQDIMNKQICYGLEARLETAVEPEYITTKDPNDPIFYSTCFVREPNREFLPLSKESKEEILKKSSNIIRHADHCLDCDVYRENLEQDALEVPQYDPAYLCSSDCSAEIEWLYNEEGEEAGVELVAFLVAGGLLVGASVIAYFVTKRVSKKKENPQANTVKPLSAETTLNTFSASETKGTNYFASIENRLNQGVRDKSDSGGLSL